ncbi:PTS transporter subunit IIC [Enterococcus cecorum]
MFLHCIHCTRKETVESISGGVNWLVYPLFQGLSFSVALYVIITGVRLFLGEIVGAFVGISEKLIPNAKPALDCPVVFPFAPTATVIGFLAAYAWWFAYNGYHGINWLNRYYPSSCTLFLYWGNCRCIW